MYVHLAKALEARKRISSRKLLHNWSNPTLLQSSTSAHICFTFFNTHLHFDQFGKHVDCPSQWPRKKSLQFQQFHTRPLGPFGLRPLELGPIQRFSFPFSVTLTLHFLLSSLLSFWCFCEHQARLEGNPESPRVEA